MTGSNRPEVGPKSMFTRVTTFPLLFIPSPHDLKSSPRYTTTFVCRQSKLVRKQVKRTSEIRHITCMPVRLLSEDGSEALLFLAKRASISRSSKRMSEKDTWGTLCTVRMSTYPSVSFRPRTMLEHLRNMS